MPTALILLLPRWWLVALPRRPRLGHRPAGAGLRVQRRRLRLFDRALAQAEVNVLVQALVVRLEQLAADRALEERRRRSTVAVLGRLGPWLWGCCRRRGSGRGFWPTSASITRVRRSRRARF